MHFNQDYKKFIEERGQEYDYVILDPPWRFSNTPPAVFREQLTYSLWDDNIQDLHWILKNIKTKYIFLWTCNSILPEVFDALKNTEYTYKTALTWVKQTSKGGLFYGLGNTFRNATEQLIVLQHKSSSKFPVKALNMSMRNVVFAPAGKRTLKPKGFEKELVDELNSRGYKGVYIFSGKQCNDLEIDTNDIIHISHK